MESFMMSLLSLVLASVCLSTTMGGGEYGVSHYPSYAPSYSAQPYTEKPTYYETYDIKADYREANATRRCGILPAVHRNEYGYEKDRVAFGEYPWQVAILDSYNNYICAGVIISPKHILTSGKCVEGKNEYDLRVRIGEYDLQSDHNYLEAYHNIEVGVCKKHHYYNVPKSYSNGYGHPYESYNPDQYSYDVTILELKEDIDFDLLPQAEPVCLPDYYYLSKTYYNEYSYGYGYNSPQPSSSHEPKNKEGANIDLECWVAGYLESPLEKISYQQEKEQQQSAYGSSSYQPVYYDYYEQSRTPRKAKVHKIYEYQSYEYQPPSYGYSTPQNSGQQQTYYAKPYKTDSWEAEYYYDACHADQGAPVVCLVPAKYEEEKEHYYTPTYQSYTPTYQSYTPSYQSYAPTYTPSYQSYIPSYESYRQKRAASYQPAYQPTYQPSYEPSYQPSYQPTYQPSYEPSYQPSYQPTYQPLYQPSYDSYYPKYEEYYKYPILPAEKKIEDYRRAVVVGVVTYGTQCSYGSYGETKKISVAPVKDILDWIQNVIHTPDSCYATYASYYPTYSPSYSTY